MTLRRLSFLTAMVLAAATPVAAQTHLLVVSGLGGDEVHRERFHAWATTMVRAAEERFGVPDSHTVYLAGDVRDPAGVDGRATKEQVMQAFRDLAERMRADAQLLVVLIGHGSYQGDQPRFSLPGPDMTAQDFAEALALFPSQTVALVNTTSASGDFIEALSGERRTIVTATKSAFERNETIFGQYFVEAFAGDVADVDKDERVSVLEAFNYARAEVARRYEGENRLLTEHAMLDDDGDGKGAAAPGEDQADGRLARQFFLTGVPAGVAGAATDDPELAALYGQRDALERELAVLRSRKDSMEEEAYERELERLLLALARTGQAIREKEAGKE